MKKYFFALLIGPVIGLAIVIYLIDTQYVPPSEYLYFKNKGVDLVLAVDTCPKITEGWSTHDDGMDWYTVKTSDCASIQFRRDYIEGIKTALETLP